MELKIDSEKVEEAMKSCPDAEKVLKILFPEMNSELKSELVKIKRCSFKEHDGLCIGYQCGDAEGLWNLIHLGDDGYIRFYTSISNNNRWKVDGNGELIIAGR